MLRTFLGGLATIMLAGPPALAADYRVKATDRSMPPKALPDAVRKLLEEKSVQFLDKDKVLAEVWFRKEVPAKATEAQIKNGLTYQEVPPSTLLAAIELKEPLIDYRKQKIKKGVYTMRLAIQPMDGDHMGTAPNAEFVLLAPADADDGKATWEPEKLVEQGKKASGTGHPAVFLLFPVAKKDLGKAPALEKKEGNHWVLNVTRDVSVDGKTKATLGIGLTLVGVSPAA
jgi:hypothetical protein